MIRTISSGFSGIGSNEGDRLATISSAIKQLGRLPGIAVTQMATILESDPAGGPPQGPYLNTVVELDTALAPRELLAALKRLEQACGRVPSLMRWAPRPLDLDLLLYGDQVMRETDLVIPHERMHERRFVLEPLAQLAPDLLHPVLHRTITELLERVVAGPAREAQCT